MSHLDLQQALIVAQEAARAAGAILQSWQERFTIKEKALFDLVTEADHAAQEAIQQIILQSFPDHAFLGEETPAAESTAALSSSKPLWVVDPLDGTTNYIHHNPCYAVSIGLVHDGRPVVGVVYDPSHDEMFIASAGTGATLNGKPLRVSTIGDLGQALIAMGFPADWRGNQSVIAAWQQFGFVTQGMRRTGSSALNLAYVAVGRFDAFFAFQQSPWDVAAGMLISQEAGGSVSQLNGQPYDVLHGNLIAASNGVLHPEVLRGLQHAVTG